MNPEDFNLDFILANSCWNYDADWKDVEDWMIKTNQTTDWPGWRKYEIETHCTTFEISAKMIDEGDFSEGVWLKPPHYIIRGYKLIST